MTVPLSPTSARRVHAKAFGAELTKALAKRGVSRLRLAQAARVTPSAIDNWKAGGNLPRTDTAARMAEALHWPALLRIAQEGRTGTCPTCSRTFVNEGGSGRTYCSPECQEIAVQLRRPVAGAVLAGSLRRMLDTPGAIRRDYLTAVLDEYGRSEAKRVQRVDKAAQRVTVLQSRIDAMCRSCEPEGLCRDAACPLRPVSPLPLPLAPERVAAEVRPAGSSWDEANREKTLAAIREGNARRWASDEERERMSVASRTYHRTMTAEERAEHGRKISEGRRRSLAKRQESAA